MHIYTKRWLPRLFAALCVLGGANALHAQAADDGFCRNGSFEDDSLSGDEFNEAKVVGKGRLYFLDDRNGCPRATRDCRSSDYVLPGDTLIVGRTLGAFRYAFYPDDKGGFKAGWVEVDRLHVLPQPKVLPVARWLGKWVDGDNYLILRSRGEKLAVFGEAFWPSANPPFPRDPHVGGIRAEAAPNGNRVIFVDEECCVSATLLGKWLVVDDNLRCGGANVSFFGFYHRQ